MTHAAHTFPVTAWRTGRHTPATRFLPEETAVALTYDRATFAVMMATPRDLEDFAVGFSLSEGIIAAPCDIMALEIIGLEAGIECRLALTPARRDALEARRRRIAGPAGCGLCGIDSLAEAIRAPTPVTSTATISAGALQSAFTSLGAAQTLNHQTRAVHAAAFLSGETLLVREDIGRHNALDKVIEAALRQDANPNTGVILLTSRVSIELIQKTAIFGAPILAAISVPTARAVREAEAANITLIAIARDDGFEVFTHPTRITTI